MASASRTSSHRRADKVPLRESRYDFFGTRRGSMAGSMGDTRKPSATAAGRRMTASDVTKVRKLIQEWDAEPMDWELIRAKVLVKIQIPGNSAARKGKDLVAWTRQALSAHPEIKEAYQTRKAELAKERGRTEKDPRRNSDSEVVLLRKDRDALRKQVADLEAKLAEYEELFHRTVYHRFQGETAPEKLMAPLPEKFDRLGRKK